MANKKTTSSKKSTSSKSSSSVSNNYKKQLKKDVKKFAKKKPKTFLIIVLVALLVVGAAVAIYFLVLRNNQPQNESTPSEPSTPRVATEGISINFLMTGNKGNGDAIYIKAGEVDILIDAGSTKSSAKTIKEAIGDRCADGKLEYVIATHADSDHITGFIGTTTIPGIFDSYKIGTLIQFAKSNKESGSTYNQYATKRDNKLSSGDIEHFYTAYECVNETNGAKKEYQITESISMTILNQRFYTDDSSDENNYSVCTLFTHGSNHYLFTGDLESDGEESLVSAEMNNNLPHCQLFKAGHHGSKTSSNDCLLSVIQPEVVCVCCTAGYNEYYAAEENVFPTQAAVNRIGKYTNKVYVTEITSDNTEGFEPMNGNIEFKCDNGVDYTVTGSNNSTILKETEWFKANRTWPTGGK